MKKYILLLSIVTVVLVISGCTNNKYSNETMNNKTITSNKATTTQEKSDLKNVNEHEGKNLEASFKEINDLKKTNIEDARNFEASLKNGSVIMISRDDSENLEVYNISMLDRFLDSFNNGKEGYVRIIKGTIVSGKLLVNKLDELETDGKVIKDTVYDTYTYKDKFTAGTPVYSSKIVKTYPNNGIRYALLENKETPDNMGTTVISFNKNSIKN
ncbi:DUF4362 domain-containing protein [Clostridium akagii]|uniref:DUF4362 domain-containing protein n=1 Tax=Clostridium akagii TaxID=91623 RepID=UPI000478D1B6|nr:DUF4362 domain-containing protein [Clostridium akagii]